jgi:YHS domain-containing protein
MHKKKIVVLLMAGVIGAGGLFASGSWAAGHHHEAKHEEHGSAAVTHHEATPGEEASGNVICPVTGEKMGEMEKLTIEHEGRTVNLCCQYCVGEFKKNPEKYRL